jgi:hypothetical protein
MESLRLLGAVSAAAFFIAAGCGGDDSDDGSAEAPATTAAEQTREPGSPSEGEPDYTGLGTWWNKLSTAERLDSAQEFIDDNPDNCEGVEAVDLERQTGIAFGYDFPEATPTDAVMLETCALILDGAPGG